MEKSETDNGNAPQAQKNRELHRLRSWQCWCIPETTIAPKCLDIRRCVPLGDAEKIARCSLSDMAQKKWKRKWRRWTSGGGCRAQWCMPRHAAPSKCGWLLSAQDRGGQTSWDQLFHDGKDHTELDDTHHGESNALATSPLEDDRQQLALQFLKIGKSS